MAEDVSAPATITGSTDVMTNTETTDTTSTDQPSNDFRSLLSDEYKSHSSLQEYKDLNGLAKSHIELSKMMGNSVRLPGEDATEEQLNKFYAKLGRPEESSKYELKSPEATDLPEGFEFNQESLSQFKELAFGLGLTNKQASALQENYLNQAIEQHKTSYTSPEKMEEEFQEKGKEIFGDKFQHSIDTAKKMINENLSEEKRAKLDNLGNDDLLAVASLLNNVHSKFFKEDSVNTSYSQASTEEDSKNQLKSLVDKRDAMDKFDPNYKEVNNKINSMYERGVKLY